MCGIVTYTRKSSDKEALSDWKHSPPFPNLLFNPLLTWSKRNGKKILQNIYFYSGFFYKIP